MKELSFLHSRRRFLAGNVALLAALAIVTAAQAAPRSSTEPTSTAKETAEVYTAWPFDAKQAAKMQKETAEVLNASKLARIDLGGSVTIDFTSKTAYGLRGAHRNA